MSDIQQCLRVIKEQAKELQEDIGKVKVKHEAALYAEKDDKAQAEKPADKAEEGKVAEKPETVSKKSKKKNKKDKVAPEAEESKIEKKSVTVEEEHAELIEAQQELMKRLRMG